MDKKNPKSMSVGISLSLESFGNENLPTFSFWETNPAHKRHHPNHQKDPHLSIVKKDKK
jgi:hypothetical protein